MKLSNKVALITGSAQGIGAAIGKRLAKAGATVCLCDIDIEKLKQTTQEIETLGFKATPFAVDITQKSKVNEVLSHIIKTHGALDILVNNAGIIRDGFLAKISEEDWDAVLDVNLKGAFFCCQAVFEHMKQNGGKIVNIISRAWLGNIGQSNYSASKGGLVSLTRTLALELARFHINVNAVAPGLIDTNMTQSMPQETLERLIKMQPTGKMGSVEDIAAAVEFLSCDDSNFITGQVLHVDGGKSCGLLSL